MDVIKKAQKEKERQTANLKDNLLHQLLTHNCPCRIDTLKNVARMAGLCETYSHLDNAVNELMREGKIEIHFIGDSEIYFSATPRAASHFSTHKPKND